MKIFRSVISSRGTWRLYFLGIKIFSVKRKLPSICVDAKNDVSVPKLKYLKVSVHGKNNKIYVTSDMDENTRISLMVFGNNNVIRINTKRFINADIIIGLNDVKIENAFLLIDDETSINGVKILMSENGSRVVIGKDCMFSSGVEMWCSDTHCVLDLQGNLLNVGQFIEIGNHVWVGKDVHFTKNTKIADNSIVGWCSNITAQFDEKNVIVAGNPARIVKRNIQWNSMRPNEYLTYQVLQNK